MSSLLFQKRDHNSDRNGRTFSEDQKVAVWQKARAIAGRDPAQYRHDSCGAIIEWSAFGTTIENGAGWEIDHIMPVAHGGGDEIGNLQALQWQHNRHKSDSVGTNYCFLSHKVA